MFEVTSTEDHVTFSVWPENASKCYDIMNMYVDGHFRPHWESRWCNREDLFQPKQIATCSRIVELSIARAKQSGKVCTAQASVVASGASQHTVINTSNSTMHGGGGLLETVHMAYNFDKDLVLTPDDVFLTILAGVNDHIAKDPEKHRQVFVSFEGKKDIAVELESNSPPSMWQELGVFDEFFHKIRDEVGAKWCDATLCDFSTSTSLEKLISQLGLMESTNHYFNFEVRGMCGIKTVMLKGTVEDWCKLREKIEAFAILDLEWWLQALRLVLDQFVL